MKAVEVLMEHGVPEERIIFINLVRILRSIDMSSCPHRLCIDILT